MNKKLTMKKRILLLIGMFLPIAIIYFTQPPNFFSNPSYYTNNVEIFENNPIYFTWLITTIPLSIVGLFFSVKNIIIYLGEISATVQETRKKKHE